MTSILTNVAAMSALQTLRSIDSQMHDTQARVSSGLRVGTASDNAAYWSIATTMRSDNMALSAVQDALGLGAAKVDATYSGMETAVDVVKEIKAKLVAATEDGVDKTKIQEEIAQLQDQLKSIADSASFSGENWLQVDISASPVIKDVVGSFTRDSNGAVSVKKIEYELDGSTVLFDLGADATTGYGNGLLDSEALFSGTDGIAVPVSANGLEQDYVLKAYTTENLMGISPALTFTTTTDGQTIAFDGTVAEYIKLPSSDKWVRLDSTSGGLTGQEIAFSDGTTSYYIDIDDVATNVSNAAVGFSLYDLDITELTAVAGLMGSSFDEGDALDFMVQYVDKKLEDLISATADLGSIAMRIELQEEFVNALTDSIDSGIGRLVDADMNEESTRLKALQTQQQLAIQALSIANTSSENILSLFRQ